jgi:hypothetical protein
MCTFLPAQSVLRLASLGKIVIVCYCVCVGVSDVCGLFCSLCAFEGVCSARVDTPAQFNMFIYIHIL